MKLRREELLSEPAEHNVQVALWYSLALLLEPLFEKNAHLFKRATKAFNTVKKWLNSPKEDEVEATTNAVEAINAEQAISADSEEAIGPKPRNR